MTAGQAARIVLVEHERVLEGGDHAHPLLGLLFRVQREGPQVVSESALTVYGLRSW